MTSCKGAQVIEPTQKLTHAEIGYPDSYLKAFVAQILSGRSSRECATNRRNKSASLFLLAKRSFKVPPDKWETNQRVIHLTRGAG